MLNVNYLKADFFQIIYVSINKRNNNIRVAFRTARKLGFQKLTSSPYHMRERERERKSFKSSGVLEFYFFPVSFLKLYFVFSLMFF